MSHSRGLSLLLASRGLDGAEDDMFRSLYYSVLTHEVRAEPLAARPHRLIV
jgi:hypothetical protein